MCSDVKNSMPQLVWWQTNHSVVPSSLCEMTKLRMASSVARPPALRMTCACERKSRGRTLGQESKKAT